MSLSKVKVGDTVLFYYTPDSNNSLAGNRLVKVTSVDNTYIKGVDLNKNEPRSYSIRNASNVEHVANANERVRPRLEVAEEILHNSVVKLIDGDTVARLYQSANPDSKDVKYNRKADVIIFYEPRPQIDVEPNASGYLVRFINKKKKSLELVINSNTGITTQVVHDGVVVSRKDKATTSDFIKELIDHYGS
jgi:hypothetical protein